MSLIKLFAYDNWIHLNKILIKKFGWETTAILSDMCNVHNYAETRDELTKDGYFYYTMKKCEEELGIKKDTFTRRVKILIEMQIISIKKIGLPCRNYYKIDETKLMSIINEFDVKTNNREER